MIGRSISIQRSVFIHDVRSFTLASLLRCLYKGRPPLARSPAEVAGWKWSTKETVVADDMSSEERGRRCRGYGSVAVRGRRKEMEDAVAAEVGFVGAELDLDFFGVYDGHGGGGVAELCRERLHREIAAEVESGAGAGNVRWGEVMEAGFGKVDAAAAAVAGLVGSTAVVAVVGRTEVVVANCGDSRAVLGRDGKVVPLSSDHKPNRLDEMKRVEAAGGKVICWDGHRVMGVLATSRSIGDQYLKPFVTCEPEVTITERSEEDEFLILASDGLWDVLSNETACDVVRLCLAGEWLPKVLSGEGVGGVPADAAALLVELALYKGSSDNISVVVVDLRQSVNVLL